MKKIKRIVWSIIILSAIVFWAFSWWNSRLDPANPADKSFKTLVIAKGEDLSMVTTDLAKQGLIKSASAFKSYVKDEGLENQVQTGSFKLSPSMSGKEIAKNITAQPGDVWVTLLEGWRVEEMAEKLNSALGINKEAFISQSKEGYMFPDTYLFPKDVTVDYIVRTLQDNFDQKYSDDIKSKIRKLGLTDDQGVILASIVEREARTDEVRRMVASILLKRFKIGMALDVDSTIQYALGYQLDEKSWWKRYLTHDDLQIDSPYNTYIHVGFPPTPIANPSLSSLKAVSEADPSTPYLYYYHDSKGNSYYARTLDEHNANVANHP